MKPPILILLTLIALAPLSLPARVTPLAAPQGRIDTGTNRGALEVRLALPEFFSKTGDDSNTTKLTALFNQVLWDDLDYSGNIALVSRSFYPSGRFQDPVDVHVEDWTKPGVNAQYLAFGNTSVTGGRFFAEARLWDLGVTQNREVLAPRRLGSEATENGVRLMAHQFADNIVDGLFGGQFGIARTRIAYVSERPQAAGTKNLVKEVYVMDYDGANAFALTSYRSSSITPSWAPDGEKIAFTTFRKGVPDIEIMSDIDRRTYPFPAVGGTTGTPAWSPDGSQIAFSSSKEGGDMEIYVADWNGRNMRRLTVSKGTDISPAWNPKTGREIAFVSDRGGSPQIYIMDAEGTNVRRMISEGGSTVNPAWSSDGQNIAFAWQKSGTGRFNIYIHNLATGTNSQLTNEQGDNERPSWAPDGRHLVFASTRTGISQIFSMLADGRKIRQLTKTGRNEGPAWSSYIGK